MEALSLKLFLVLCLNLGVFSFPFKSMNSTESPPRQIIFPVNDFCKIRQGTCTTRVGCLEQGGRPVGVCFSETGVQGACCSPKDPSWASDIKEKPKDLACGVTAKKNIKTIIGGTETGIKKWPWMAQLMYQNLENGPYYEMVCGATIISSNVLVTAAHCLSNLNTFEYFLVGVGHHNRSEPQHFAWRAVKQYVVHQLYNEIYPVQDIAIVELEEPLPLHPSRARPACLHKNISPPPSDAAVIGWGRDDNDEYSNVLRELYIPIATVDECMEYLKNNSISTWFANYYICAGQNEGGKDACDGDSGGPLLVLHKGAWHMFGIVSWGIGCASPNHHGMYAKIEGNVDWINNFIADRDNMVYRASNQRFLSPE